MGYNSSYINSNYGVGASGTATNYGSQGYFLNANNQDLYSSNNYGIEPFGSSLGASSSNNTMWYQTDNWDNSWDSSFDNNTVDDSWVDSVLSFANSRVGSGLLAGAAAGYNAYQDREASQSRFNDQLAFNEKSLAEELALKEQALALEKRKLALLEAEFADKVKTRQKHNDSIGRAPEGLTKTARRTG